MPSTTANETIMQRHVRNFIQYGGPTPGNVVAYAGQDAQYMKIEGVGLPDGSGGVEPSWKHDPRRPGKYRLVSRKISPPDLAEATLVLTERHGAIPRHLQKIICPFNLYENIGDCKDLSDYLAGWSDYVLVYSGALIDGNKDLGNRSSWDTDDELEDSLPLKLSDIYPVGSLSFGAQAESDITLEALDVVYGSLEQCGDCGPADDGTQRIYAVTESSGSTPGTAPRLVYTTDGGATWSQGTVDGLGGTEDPVAIDVVGKYLVILTRIAGGPTLSGYYYSEIDSDTGDPGTWTKVTSGFVASNQVRDMYVLSPREVFFCGDNGYIYKATDITAGVEVLNAGAATTSTLQRIHGDLEETIVAVGASGTVIVSHNRGRTFATTDAAPVVATLQALAAISDSLWWVGGANGRLYYTLNGGASWTEKSFSGAGAGQVRDIIFASAECGFFSHDTADPTGRIFSSWNGGRDWTNSSPRILNMPVVDRFNRLATPAVDAGIAVNNIAAAGLAGDGADGTLLLGIASRL